MPEISKGRANVGPLDRDQLQGLGPGGAERERGALPLYKTRKPGVGSLEAGQGKSGPFGPVFPAFYLPKLMGLGEGVWGRGV